MANLQAGATDFQGEVTPTAPNLESRLSQRPWSELSNRAETPANWPSQENAAVLPADPLDGVTGINNEEVRLGERELFVLYPDGIAKTRLRIPGDKHGTARSMNTIAKLVEMTGAVA